jgi:mannosyltransferase OCH1-like enzyme
MQIPKIVHKTGPFKNFNNFPKKIQILYNHNKKNNQEYIFKYYNDEESELIVKNFDKNVLNAYNAIIPKSYKADIFRMVLLYEYGGIYSDFSQKFLVPLSKLIDHIYDNLVICENMEICFIATYPKNPLIKYIIDYQVNNITAKNYGKGKLDITGPQACKKAFNLYYQRNKYENINNGKYIFNNINIKVIGKIKYIGPIYSKIYDSYFKKKRDKMYLVDNENKKIIKLYINNHKNILYKKTFLPHYGTLYKNKMVFKSEIREENINLIMIGIYFTFCFIFLSIYFKVL